MKRRLAVLTTFAVAFLVVSGPALGDTFSVKNTNDTGPGSLRQAITDANARPGRDVVTFARGVRGTINLTKALPALRADVEIRGPGAGKLAVRRSAPDDFRIFTVWRDSTVMISGLEVSNGLAPDMDGSAASSGGGIHNNGGVLSVKDCSFSENRADSAGTGGAISNDDGRLTVMGSAFSGNRATYSGGAIGNYLGGHLTVRDSTFSSNTARFGGGAISNTSESSTTSVAGSTFTTNTSTSSGGGAIANDGTLTVSGSDFSRNEGRGGAGVDNDGVLRVYDSTFSQNEATGRGGGISTVGFARSTVVGSTFTGNVARSGGGISNSGELALRNSTFSANRAREDGGGLQNRTGHDRVGTVRIEGGTFANNSAGSTGGGLNNDRLNDAADFSLRITLLAGNEAPDGPDASGEFSGGGYNLIRDPSGSSGFGGTDLTNTRAGLDPQGLRDNGGPTRTIALVLDSPALDAVQGGCPPPTTDQRGVSRPQDGDGTVLCDIGAYERRESSP